MEQNKRISHKHRRHYLDNTYKSFILERCSYCGKDMDNIRDIWVEVESDRYICGACKNKYDVGAIRCKELNF